MIIYLFFSLKRTSKDLVNCRLAKKLGYGLVNRKGCKLAVTQKRSETSENLIRTVNIYHKMRPSVELEGGVGHRGRYGKRSGAKRSLSCCLVVRRVQIVDGNQEQIFPSYIPVIVKRYNGGWWYIV